MVVSDTMHHLLSRFWMLTADEIKHFLNFGSGAVPSSPSLHSYCEMPSVLFNQKAIKIRQTKLKLEESHSDAGSLPSFLML